MTAPRTDHEARFDAAFAKMPLIAILRGLAPDEAVAIGEAVLAGGFGILEVPLNSPDPFRSVALLARSMGERAVVGVGTAFSPGDVDRAADAGARLVVSPHADTAVIRRTKELGLASAPGVFTMTEAASALAAGADALKIFPAELSSPAAVRAMRAVLPRGVRLVMVGGVTPDAIDPYRAAGADGFGVGSDLYRPGRPPAEVESRARDYAARFGAAILA